jgi:hypothetical protein
METGATPVLRRQLLGGQQFDRMDSAENHHIVQFLCAFCAFLWPTICKD